MTSEPYVPPKIGFVRAEMHLGDGAWKKLTETEFDRFIAKIKADALREQADHIGQHGASDGTVWYNVGTDHEDYAETAEYLRMEADRIEEEA